MKKFPVLEATVKLHVKKRLKALGVYHFWPVQMGIGSVTLDCLGCVDGCFFAIETKAPGKTLTLQQKITAEKIRESNGAVLIVDSIEKAKAITVNRLKGML